MRSSPALRIAVAVSGALTVVVAIAFGAAHGAASPTLQTTVRLAAVAHAFIETTASASQDSSEIAPAGAAKASKPTSAAVPVALPATPTLVELAAACEGGQLADAPCARSPGRFARHVHGARGPPCRG